MSTTFNTIPLSKVTRCTNTIFAQGVHLKLYKTFTKPMIHYEARAACARYKWKKGELEVVSWINPLKPSGNFTYDQV
jgi:hypothetical protein